MAANKARIPLAKMAIEETGRGVLEDKVIKNHYAAEYIYNAYKDTKTCGVIERDDAYGITKIAEPIGIVGAVIPTTNPTSTAIFKDVYKRQELKHVLEHQVGSVGVNVNLVVGIRANEQLAIAHRAEEDVYKRQHPS